MKNNDINLDAAIFKIIKHSIPIREEILKHKKNISSIEDQLFKLEETLLKNKKEIKSLQNKFKTHKILTGSELQINFTRINFLKSENKLFKNKISELQKEQSELKSKVKILNKKIAEFSVKEDKLNEIINLNKRKMKELKEDLLAEEMAELMFYNKLKS